MIGQTKQHRCVVVFVKCLAVALLLVAVGCGGVNHLREAQEAFNEAAAEDNRNRFSFAEDKLVNQVEGKPDAASALLTDTNKILTGYASVLLSLEKISMDDERRLRADKLWGVKLTLEALAQWRLGRYAEALKTAEAATLEADQLFPRDAAVLAALPGLIKNDLAFEKIQAAKRDPEANCKKPDGKDADDLVDCVRDRLVGDQGAVKELQEARGKVDKSHPVNVYLILSQLAAYRNYQVAFQEVRKQSPPDADPAKKKAACNLRDLEILLEALNESTKVVSQYQLNYGVNPSQCEAASVN